MFIFVLSSHSGITTDEYSTVTITESTRGGPDGPGSVKTVTAAFGGDDGIDADVEFDRPLWDRLMEEWLRHQVKQPGGIDLDCSGTDVFDTIFLDHATKNHRPVIRLTGKGGARVDITFDHEMFDRLVAAIGEFTPNTPKA